MKKMFLKSVLVFLLVILSSGISTYASSATLQERLSDAIVLHLGQSKAFVNNKEFQIDSTNNEVSPLLKGGRTLVPLRFISESLGAVVDWNDSEKKAKIIGNDGQVSFVIGSSNMYIYKASAQEEVKQLDVPAQIINERTFIPLRALAEALDKQVFWDDRGIIVISDVENIFDINTEKVLIDEVESMFPVKKEDLTSDKVGETWFAGAIGNAKIHAKFDVVGNKVTGVYYYDKYKTNISITGTLDEDLKDLLTINLTEETDKKGRIVGLFRNKDYIEGYWRKGNDLEFNNKPLPMYLIREGSNITPPSQPGKNTMKFDALWYGENSYYYGGSYAGINALFDDLIEYDLYGNSGLNSGILGSFAIVDNSIAQTIFTDKTYPENKENVSFDFKIEDNKLKLNSNSYDYMCGMGVEFDSSYTKERIDIPMPTALDVGIVDTKEQEELFKRLVGDLYRDFIKTTSAVFYSEYTLDGNKVKASPSYLRGGSGSCYYMISPEHIYAAIRFIDGIQYYTNDKNYAEKLPQPMAEWAEEHGNLNVEYHYME